MNAALVESNEFTLSVVCGSLSGSVTEDLYGSSLTDDQKVAADASAFFTFAPLLFANDCGLVSRNFDGTVSGITIDPVSGLVAVPDDRSLHQVYTFRITITMTGGATTTFANIYTLSVGCSGAIYTWDSAFIIA